MTNYIHAAKPILAMDANRLYPSANYFEDTFQSVSALYLKLHNDNIDATLIPIGAKYKILNANGVKEYMIITAVAEDTAEAIINASKELHKGSDAPDLTPYATKDYVDEKIAEIPEPVIPEPDLSNCLLKDGDEITYEEQHNVLSTLNDKPYDSTKQELGYKVLRTDQTFASQIADSNTVYEIKDLFDLEGTESNPVTISLPANSIIRFNGGVLKNCSLVGNNTVIEAGNYKIFDNVTFSGTFVGTLNVIWVGATPNDSSFNNSTIFQRWFDSYSSVFKDISFPTGIYYFKTPVSLDDDIRHLKLNGNNSRFYIDIDDINGEGATFMTLQGPQTTKTSGGEDFILENVRFVNVKNSSSSFVSKTIGLWLNRTHRFALDNISFYHFDKAIHLTDVFYGGFTGKTTLVDNRIGIYVDIEDYKEVNTIDFHNITIKGCTNEVAKALWPQNDGETDENYNLRTAVCGIDFHALCNGCKFYGLTIEYCDYGIRFNHKESYQSQSMRSDVVTIDSCYFEQNNVYDIYVGPGYIPRPNGYTNTFKFYHNVSVSNCRFETLKRVYFYTGYYYFINNQTVTIDLKATTSTGNTMLVYNGNHTINWSSYCFGRKLNNMHVSSSLLQTSYDNILNIARGSGIITTSSLDLSDANDNYSNLDSLIIPDESNIGIFPTVKLVDIIKPYQIYTRVKGSYAYVKIPSGNTTIDCVCDITRFRNSFSIEGITLRSFIDKWTNNTTYTGKVQGLFPYTVTADPTTGIITRNDDSSIVGFGTKALEDNTYPKTNGYYVLVEGLINVRYINSRLIWHSDIVQCCRTYSEVKPERTQSSTSMYELQKVFGSTTTRNSVQKNLNSIFYDTTESKMKIYNGYDWVDMESPHQRFIYKEIGNSISERATIPDLPGQTFYNKATGIKYTFSFRTTLLTPKWRSSIGSVDSLEHPNGYNATDNPLDYATELQTGEKVIYMNELYTWTGSGFTKDSIASKGATSDRPTLTSDDAGRMYFDTTLGKYICWNGTDWINLDGSSLS